MNGVLSLLKRLEEEFASPFLPEGFVRVVQNPPGHGFALTVGDCDVQFDDDGRVVGSGSNLSQPEWGIVRRPGPESLEAAFAATEADALEEAFTAGCRFAEHEDGCAECGGELETGPIPSRLRYLCDQGKQIMSAWDPEA